MGSGELAEVMSQTLGWAWDGNGGDEGDAIKDDPSGFLRIASFPFQHHGWPIRTIG
jgi:hypothetical protein